jgi:hypothetical protein
VSEAGVEEREPAAEIPSEARDPKLEAFSGRDPERSRRGEKLLDTIYPTSELDKTKVVARNPVSPYSGIL